MEITYRKQLIPKREEKRVPKAFPCGINLTAHHPILGALLRSLVKYGCVCVWAAGAYV